MARDGVDRYGVMGYPVSHSRSPVIHRLFALQTRQNLEYELLPVPPGKLETAVREFAEAGGKGLNITLPHKNAAAALADRLSERARRAGAVNTLDFRDGRVFGDNTDGVGLMRDLTRNLGVVIADIDILVLGAGGATRGILGPLLNGRPRSVTIANRDFGKARELADVFSSEGRVRACRFREVPAADYGLLINATSAGLKGETPPWPQSAVAKDTLCYDLSYGLSPTPFSRWCIERGAEHVVMGWGMLVEQAAESFLLWRGIRPDTGPVLRQMAINA
ncbi:MAG TPA: shikimate dehydrogenase [Woeseiaceae bacterium]|nr:shikimate dehydrogenase [Woeseiaceae bacterium]